MTTENNDYASKIISADFIPQVYPSPSAGSFAKSKTLNHDKDMSQLNCPLFLFVENAIKQCVLSAVPDNAKTFHSSILTSLTQKGWDAYSEHQVTDRGDGKPGRIDIAIKSPVCAFLELDRGTARAKSILKLRSVQGYRFVVLRTAHSHPDIVGIDSIICYKSLINHRLTL